MFKRKLRNKIIKSNKKKNGKNEIREERKMIQKENNVAGKLKRQQNKN